MSVIAKLGYRRVSGIIVAVVILTAVFVPFQQATAFTVTVDLPESDAGEINASVAGEPFEITIDVEAGELISIDEIRLILDNGEETVKTTVFNSTGHRIEGSESLVVNNELTISAFSDEGYAYGFGSVSNGITGFSSYSYSFTSTYGYIGGNTGGYANAGVTDFVTGLIGPGEITITGNLRTANLADGTHTLDVLINTGAGVDPDELTIDPPFTFEVTEDNTIVVVELDVPAGEIKVEVNTQDSDGNSVSIELNLGAPAGAGKVTTVVQSPAEYITANTPAQLTAKGLTASGSQLQFTTGVAGTTFSSVGVVADIDISALGLPDGTEVTIGLEYDDTGLTTSEEEEIRLMHLPDGTTEWEVLLNTNATINGGDEVDTVNNIVYGTTDDFSLFGPAVATQEEDDDDDAPSGGGGGGGGSRTVVITWPPIDTLPASHFINFPLARIQVASSAFVNAQGLSIAEAQVNQQVSISGEFTNQQPTEQTYAFIVQVTDEAGFVTDIAWQQGTLQSGSTADVSTLWTPETDGTFTVKIFVWNGISAAPEPLSEVTVKNIAVTG